MFFLIVTAGVQCDHRSCHGLVPSDPTGSDYCCYCSKIQHYTCLVFNCLHSVNNDDDETSSDRGCIYSKCHNNEDGIITESCVPFVTFNGQLECLDCRRFRIYYTDDTM